MSWVHIRDSIRRARKPHVCLLCLESIPIGEKYISRFGYSDRKPYGMDMHFECERETWAWDDMDWETAEPGFIDRPQPLTTDHCPLTFT